MIFNINEIFLLGGAIKTAVILPDFGTVDTATSDLPPLEVTSDRVKTFDNLLPACCVQQIGILNAFLNKH